MSSGERSGDACVTLSNAKRLETVHDYGKVDELASLIHDIRRLGDSDREGVFLVEILELRYIPMDRLGR